MNDIVKCSDELKYSMYADDACVWSANKNLQDSVAIMNSELTRINKWMSSNCLTLNKDKCEYVVFKNKSNRVPDASVHISIDDLTLTRRHFTKYLGLYIDERLSWDVHINYVIRKISIYAPILYNIRGSPTRDSLEIWNYFTIAWYTLL